LIKGAVLDASVAISWLLPGEDSALTLPLKDFASNNPQLALFVTGFFYYEVANALWVARRRKRVSQDVAKESLQAIIDFHLSAMMPGPDKCLQLSFEKDLAVYDAAYLVLAMQEEVPLWTLDRALASVAKSLKVAVEPV